MARLVDGQVDVFTLASIKNTQQRIKYYEGVKAKTSDAEWHRICDEQIRSNQVILDRLTSWIPSSG